MLRAMQGGRRRGVVLLTIVGLLGLGVGMTAPGAGAATKPKTGGTLTYLMTSQVPIGTGFDPALMATTQSVALSGPPLPAIFDALVLPNTTTFQAQPRLAESIKSSDAIVWTIKLRT